MLWPETRISKTAKIHHILLIAKEWFAGCQMQDEGSGKAGYRLFAEVRRFELGRALTHLIFVKNSPMNLFCRMTARFVPVLFVLITSWDASHAQTVSTFLTANGLNGPDGFALDTAGNLYVANWSGGTGNTVLKITPVAVANVFDSTSSAPDGLAFDQEGNLYVSNYSSGIIHKITTSGVKTVYASGLINPSALAFDSAGNLYVSNFGSTNVSKITPGGNISSFASGFSGPLGLVFDPQWNLYVSNYNTGKIHKVTPDGNVTVFATVPNGNTSKIQYLARGQSGNLYLPSYGHHKIYRISTAGMVSVLAGTGVPGSKDGSVDSAQFNGPNSIALKANGDLYISEYNANRIRLISGVEFPLGNETGNMNPSSDNILFQNCPNPFSGQTRITFSLSKPGLPSVMIYNILGSEILKQDFPQLLPGEYSFIVPSGRIRQGLYVIRLVVDGQAAGSKKAVCNPLAE